MRRTASAVLLSGKARIWSSVRMLIRFGASCCVARATSSEVRGATTCTPCRFLTALPVFAAVASAASGVASPAAAGLSDASSTKAWAWAGRPNAPRLTSAVALRMALCSFVVCIDWILA